MSRLSPQLDSDVKMNETDDEILVQMIYLTQVRIYIYIISPFIGRMIGIEHFHFFVVILGNKIVKN